MKTELNFPPNTMHAKLSLKFIYLLRIYVLIFCVFFIKCTKDETIVSNQAEPSNDKSISTRSGTPGSYSIIDGRIAFDDLDEYKQTVEYMADATEAQKSDLRDDFTIETSEKMYWSFWNLMDDPNMTESEYEDLKDDYEGKVAFSINSEGDDEFDRLYPFESEFCNLNGEFQIGNTIVKYTANKIINITDPSKVTLSHINDNTVTDTTKGIIVFNVIAGRQCCKTVDEDKEEWATGPRRRFTTRYAIANETKVEAVAYPAPSQYDVTPQIGFYSYGRSQVRKCFIFICTWNKNKVTLSHDFVVSVSHTLGPWGLSSPVGQNIHLGPSANEWKFDHARSRTGSTTRVNSNNLPPTAATWCVNNALDETGSTATTVKASVVCN